MNENHVRDRLRELSDEDLVEQGKMVVQEKMRKILSGQPVGVTQTLLDLITEERERRRAL